MSNWLERYSLYIGLAAAWIAMLGSLYFSEVMEYIPCTLCWYQRILMYPLAGIIAIGLLRRDRELPYYVLPFSVFGIGVATYHYLIQRTDIFGGEVTCKVGVPCTTIWINWLGFATIPFLSLVAFVIITVVALIALQAEESAFDADGPAPWQTVGGVIVLIAAIFAVLAILNRPSPANAAAVETPALSTISPELASKAESMSVDGLIADGDGAQLYQESCAGCHGDQLGGVAGLGNSLAESAVVKAMGDDELLALIRNGRTADDPDHGSGVPMPPNGGRVDLTDAEILAIVGHIRAGQADD